MAQAAVDAMKARVILKRTRPTNMETSERRYSLKRPRGCNNALVPPAKRPKLYNCLFGVTARQLEVVKQRALMRKINWYTSQLDKGCPPPYSLQTYLLGRAQKPQTSAPIVPDPTNTKNICFGRDVQITEPVQDTSSQKGALDGMLPDYAPNVNIHATDYDSVHAYTSRQNATVRPDYTVVPDHIYAHYTDSARVDVSSRKRAHDTVVPDCMYARDIQISDSVYVDTSTQKRVRDIVVPDYMYGQDVQTAAPVHVATGSQNGAHDNNMLPDYDENEYSALLAKRQRPSVQEEEADTAPMKKWVLSKKNNARRIQVQRRYRNSNLAGVSNPAVTPWVPPEPADISLSCSITKTTHTETDASATTSAPLKSILKKRSFGMKTEAVSDIDAKTDVPAHVGQKRVRFLLEPDTNKDTDEFSSPSTKRQRLTSRVQEKRGKATPNKRRILVKKRNCSSSLAARRIQILRKYSNVTGISNVVAKPRNQLKAIDDTPAARWVAVQLNKLCAEADAPVPCSRTVLERVAKGKRSWRKTQCRSNSQESDSEENGSDSEELDSEISESESDSSDPESDTDSSGDSSDESDEEEVVKDKPAVELQQKQITAAPEVSTPSSQVDAPTLNSVKCPAAAINGIKAPTSDQPPKSDSIKTALTVSESKKSCITIERLISLLLAKLSFASATPTVKPAKLVGNPFKLHLKRHHRLKRTFVSRQCVRLLKSQIPTLLSDKQPAMRLTG